MKTKNFRDRLRKSVEAKLTSEDSGSRRRPISNRVESRPMPKRPAKKPSNEMLVEERDIIMGKVREAKRLLAEVCEYMDAKMDYPENSIEEPEDDMPEDDMDSEGYGRY